MNTQYIGRGLVLVVVLAAVPSPTAAQTQPAINTTETTSLPRTPSGDPDLNGVWDFRTLTPFERPKNLAEKAFFTDDEATEFEAGRLSEFAVRDDKKPEDIVGNYNQFWFDPGSRVGDTNRTSLVIDPPNGRVPPMTGEAKEKRAAQRELREGVGPHMPTFGGFVEDLGSGGAAVRCILGFNSGPPMTPGGYNQNVQLVQTPSTVALVNEMVHSSRIIPINGRDHLSDDIRQWMGDSRGHWEGDTLVVETKHFLRETSFRGGVTSSDLRLIERFTKTSGDTLMYEVTIEDPNAWVHPWSYAIPMRRNHHPLFEYACHEGNYGLYNILAGARMKEKAAKATGELPQ
jgi:hypothetical protein